jgi:hypothetical protein
MFQLSLIDHLRLSFGSVVGAYQGHTAAADRLARWDWYAKVATLAVVGLATACGLIALRYGGAFQMIAVVLMALAFGFVAVHIAFDPGSRIYGHRAHAARLWRICEKYRALLTEVHDDLLDVGTVMARRDALLDEFGALSAHSAPSDRQTYEIAQKALSGAQLGAYSDQELDGFLPSALRRSASPITAESSQAH